MLDFKSKVLVILIKCSSKISDDLLSSKIIQSSSEIIILLENLPLSEKLILVVRQKVLLSNTSFGFTCEK